MEIIKEYLDAGGRLFQLREKTLDKTMLLEYALTARKMADDYNALFILNDCPETAARVKADGVHLGQSDMPPAEARKIIGEDYIIGVSTHNTEQAIEAVNSGADYINIGPVFSTPTKPNADALGFCLIDEIIRNINIPFTFMGGIKENNIPGLLKYNPAAVAMVTEISKSQDVFEKVKSLLNIIN
jgi:thiamine-phosphate pyrophosphorylase